jgi:hypothetical protein
MDVGRGTRDHKSRVPHSDVHRVHPEDDIGNGLLRIGTVLETMMIWELLQVRHLKDTPLILVEKMWPGLIVGEQFHAFARSAAG